MNSAEQPKHTGLTTRYSLIASLQQDAKSDSWEVFTATYKHYIYSVLKGMSLPPSDSDDLCQKVLLRVWKGIDKFQNRDDKRSFRPWLVAVIRNEVRTFWRESTRKQKQFDASLEDPSSIEAEIDIQAEKEWKIFIAQKAWENLKPSFNEKVVQVFEALSEGADPADLAKQMALERNTIYVYRKRVLQKLYREIRRLEDELS